MMQNNQFPMLLRCFCLGSALALAPTFATAQQNNAATTSTATAAVALLADNVSFNNGLLIAEGSVEIYQNGRRLTASRILYDSATQTLKIEGPIRLTEPGGETEILAASAELDTAFRNGILTSARMIIDQKLQLASAQIERVDGRYTRMERTVASTCTVCADRPVPIWEIRAKEVIHDDQTRQIYFSDAHFRLFGMPVFYLPNLRVPDPTLKRSTGFLIPEISTDTELGWGIKVPYFITLGDHQDLTFSPYIAEETNTINLSYRRAYANGDLDISGAITQDTLEDDLRGYLFFDGSWDIGKGLTFGTDIQLTSDIAYLVDYGIYGGDRLPSSLTLIRYGANEAIDIQLVSMRTLRESELATEDTLPFLLGEARYEKRYWLNTLPGSVLVGGSFSGSYRVSDDDIDGTDILRIGTDATWQNGTTFGPGLQLDGSAGVYFDAYSLYQNSAYDDQVARITPAFETRLSWPLSRTTTTGATQVIEPISQIGWSESFGSDVPNIDSELVEFDEGNLLSLSRFPGADRRGDGLTGAIGLRFSHISDTFNANFTLGQVFFDPELSDIGVASGLSGASSNYLIASHLSFGQNIRFTSRALIDHDFEFTKWENRLDLSLKKVDVGAHYSYVIADVLEDRTTDLSEVSMDATVALAKNWSATGEYLYDFTENAVTNAGLTFVFQNECTRVSLGVARSYYDTTVLDPKTTYSFSVGFGAYDNQSSCGF